MTIALIGMICAMSMMPGTATTVILDTTWTHGRRLGFVTALGGSAGVALHTLLALFAGMHLAHSGALSGIWINRLEGAGALYLAALGVMALIEAFSLRANATVKPTSAVELRALLSGLFSTVLSPKLALFYLVILPQYDFSPLSPLRGILLVGIMHLCIRLAWYGTWIHLIEPVRRALQGVWIQRAMKLTTATLLIALSLYIAL